MAHNATRKRPNYSEGPFSLLVSDMRSLNAALREAPKTAVSSSQKLMAVVNFSLLAIAQAGPYIPHLYPKRWRQRDSLSALLWKWSRNDLMGKLLTDNLPSIFVLVEKETELCPALGSSMDKEYL